MSFLLLAEETSATDRALQVSYIDLTTPSVTDNRVEVSWTELELTYSATDVIPLLVVND